MPDALLPISGSVIQASDHLLPRARAIAELARSGVNPYVTYVESLRLGDSGGAEVVVLDLAIEVPQHPVCDIRPMERVAISMSADDRRPPETLALRADFPLVPHLNLTVDEYPRSFCLFDEPWLDLKLVWTAVGHVERIREWLRQSARGELHESNQPLEPLILGAADTLVLPTNLAMETDDGAALPIRLHGIRGHRGRLTIVAEWGTREPRSDASTEATHFVATIVQANPTIHGVMRKQPVNLGELNDILQGSGLDLIRVIQDRLRAWHQQGQLAELLGARLILITLLPKRRHEGAEPEDVETWAFLTHATIADVGEQVGLWQMSGGKPGWLVPPDETRRGTDSQISPLNPMRPFTRDRAAWLNGEPANRAKMVLVGAGALGSQLFLHLLRAGFGEWTLIDDDTLLPHNLARHGLLGFALGLPKADVLADVANLTIAGDPIATAVIADVTSTTSLPDDLAQRLADAEVIVDCSASVGVARYLTRTIDSPARRASVFMNPTGTDVVLLVEDRYRASTLDVLEMQYHRAVLQHPELAAHLANRTGRLRYGVGCRDRSAVIAQDLIALHAATMARALKIALADDGPTIRLSQARDDCTLSAVQPASSRPVRVAHNGWDVVTDREMIEVLGHLRAMKLPNETGGVLIGAFDVEHRTVYLAEAVPSPEDSIEWPTLYIRGCQGLQERVREIERRTGGSLRYVGEWHSHPKGHGCKPSADDAQVMAWLREAMARDGLPAVMTIAAEHNVCVMIDTVENPSSIRRAA